MAAYDARPAADEYVPYFSRYIALVPDGDVVDQLEHQVEETRRMLDAIPSSHADHAYAPGKWTIKEVIGHLADSERVFAYRALRFARGDTTELAPFDENAYVPAAAFGARTLADIADEFVAVRRATVASLRGLPHDAWSRRGVAGGNAMSVRALAWTIAGHELHHRALLVERYGVGQLAGGA
ncbi:MAG TPA: DinB family protein [Longimicrobiales bacterium]